MLPLHSLCNKKVAIPSIGLALVLLISSASLTSSCNEQEKSSLLQFLARLSKVGGLAVSWQNDTDCCAWEGISCNGDGAVTDLSLASRNLEGHISPSLGALTGLLRLNLSRNSLCGNLPKELVYSSSIVVLDVSFNRLNGDLQELPSSSAVQPMQVLNISSNFFAGQFPSTTWEAMKNLVALNASNNSFTGQIPTRFCSSSQSFAVLVLSYNQFTGSIPPGLGGCSMLRVLKVGNNKIRNGLEGKIDGMLLLKLRNLVTLNLGGNKFSGNIPDSVVLEVLGISSIF